MSVGPQNPFSSQLHAEKYRSPNESFEEAMGRISVALTDNEKHQVEFKNILTDMRFMPAGRIQAGAGSPKNVTLSNCFVAPELQDSFVAGDNSIMAVATKAAQTMRMGGGIGFSFSTLRPNGALIKKLHSESGGPLSFMPIFDAICKATSSAGNRRGAMMGIMSVSHPDILDFIKAKQPQPEVQALWDVVDMMEAGPQRMAAAQALQHTLRLTGFNLSVDVNDEFMEALERKGNYKLRFDGRVVGEANAEEVWNEIMGSTWDWAEPGVLFLDQANRRNPLWYCRQIIGCNPCSEKIMWANGNCLLGSYNLIRYVHNNYFDWDQFKHDIPIVLRAMDNVTDVSSFPLPEQEEDARQTRQIGIGITALANAGETLGFPYGSPEFIEFQTDVLNVLRDETYRASSYLAVEKGSFPLYDKDRYTNGWFFKTLAPDVQDLIRKNGLRNSHLLSVAPTGTISLTADNVSSSIEPVFAVEMQRKVKMVSGDVLVDVKDYAFEKFGTKPKTANEVSIDEHLEVLLTTSNRVDSSVSKTLNVPSSVDRDEFQNIYRRGYHGGAIGLTTFRIDGKRMGIFQAKESVGEACTFDPETGKKTCD